MTTQKTPSEELDKILEEIASPDNWSERKFLLPEAKAKIEQCCKKREVGARIDELEKLNIYYFRHDGEGEHKLATSFDKRIKSLREQTNG